MDDLPRELLPVLREADPDSRGGERRFSDTDRPSVPRPTSSQIYRPSLPADVRSAEDHAQVTPLQQHVCCNVNCAAREVLETTELLETILNNLCTADVLRFRLTKRAWDETVCTSPSLRLHLFVHPQWHRHPRDFQLLSLTAPGLSIQPGEEIEMGRWISIRMAAAAARKIKPPSARLRSRSIFEGLRRGLGSHTERSEDSWPVENPRGTGNALDLKHGDLQVMRPPVLGLQAFVSQSNEESPDEDLRACAKLHCDSGINLGFLAETALTLLATDTSSDEYDGSTVLFKAIVSFAAPPPTLRGRRSIVRSVTRID